MPLGHLIILLKSNKFNMAAPSVQRSIPDNFSRRQEAIQVRMNTYDL